MASRAGTEGPRALNSPQGNLVTANVTLEQLDQETVGLEMTSFSYSSSTTSESGPESDPPAVEIKQVPSFGMATPPVTPPLSVASYHGSTTSTSSSSNSLYNAIDGTNNASSNSRSSRSSRRKRPRRKSLAGHHSGSSSHDNAAADYGERRYGDVAPSFSSSLSSPSYFCGEDGDSGDDGYSGGGGNRPVPQRLLPPLFPSKTAKSPADGRRRRRRRRCCCCRLSSRCLLVVGLCLMTAYLTFKIVWYFQWQARCVEGCYDPSMAKTGSHGPEQVHIAYSGVDEDGNPTGMAVVWTTAAGQAPPVVEYGLSKDDLSLTAIGTSVSYLDTVHHRASLEGLAPGTRFFYRCGNPNPHLSEADDAAGVSTATGTGTALPALDVMVGGEEEKGGENLLLLDSGENDGVSEGGGAGAVGVGLDSEGPSSSKRSPGVRGARGGGGGAMELRDAGKWSSVFSFVTAPEAERWEGDGPWDRPVSVAVVGDLGLVNAGATFDRLHQLVDDNEIDFVMHLGDIGYADDAFLERPWSFGYEDKWDAFMRRTSHEFASKIPYMVVPGNHEAECHSPACLSSPRRLKALGNFAAFNSRFRMPSLESRADHGTSMWYSFNVGPVHFVVVDTETDFPGAGGDHLSWVGGFEGGGEEGGNGGFGDQVAWLEEDLALANQERDVRPWIIAAGHRPMYATEKSDSDGRMSSGHSNRIRKVFEPILEKNKVDVYLSGHVHAFERSLPVFDNVPRFNEGGDGDVVGGSDEDSARRWSTPADAGSSSKMVYEDPVAPVHIVNGAGGCLEGFTIPVPVYPSKLPHWRAMAMSMVPGVGILTFPSKAEMRSTFLTSDSPAEILDELTVRHQRAPLA